jgi:hypothetical protein
MIGKNKNSENLNEVRAAHASSARHSLSTIYYLTIFLDANKK